jgi:hypothetical protein
LYCPDLTRSRTQADPLPKGVKWRFMEHKGVCFPPAYEPHGIKMNVSRWAAQGDSRGALGKWAEDASR